MLCKIFVLFPFMVDFSPPAWRWRAERKGELGKYKIRKRLGNVSRWVVGPKAHASFFGGLGGLTEWQAFCGFLRNTVLPQKKKPSLFLVFRKHLPFSFSTFGRNVSVRLIISIFCRLTKPERNFPSWVTSLAKGSLKISLPHCWQKKLD